MLGQLAAPAGAKNLIHEITMLKSPELKLISIFGGEQDLMEYGPLRASRHV
jgi:hypothetical protein